MLQDPNPDDAPAELIVRIASSLVDDDRAVALELQSLPKRINWLLKVDINDQGKLIGKRGAHLKAFALVVKAMGARRGEDWRLLSVPPDEAERVDRPPAKTPATYNALPSLQLLHETAANLLDQPAHITIAEDETNNFAFTINPRAVQDYERLVEHHEIAPARGEPRDGDHRPAERLTLVAALGTLWHAYGKREGVTFRVIVPSR